MTQEEKQLLLKDLCAKLPYGVKVCARFNTGNRYTADVTAICADRDYIETRQNALHPYRGSSVEDIRPYLRPMSSMTEEEQEAYDKWHEELEEGRIKDWKYAEYNDWLNAHHFDFRNLIGKGLAIDCTNLNIY